MATQLVSGISRVLHLPKKAHSDPMTRRPHFGLRTHIEPKFSAQPRSSPVLAYLLSLMKAAKFPLYEVGADPAPCLDSSTKPL